MMAFVKLITAKINLIVLPIALKPTAAPMGNLTVSALTWKPRKVARPIAAFVVTIIVPLPKTSLAVAPIVNSYFRAPGAHTVRPAPLKLSKIKDCKVVCRPPWCRHLRV